MFPLADDLADVLSDTICRLSCVASAVPADNAVQPQPPSTLRSPRSRLMPSPVTKHSVTQSPPHTSPGLNNTNLRLRCHGRMHGINWLVQHLQLVPLPPKPRDLVGSVIAAAAPAVGTAVPDMSKQAGWGCATLSSQHPPDQFVTLGASYNVSSIL
ncbi:hypothetical protein G7Z17_g8252 [Cylindrodendrum hubeiense]|uniref:Uncharacterized protein n=1 Tax=Cylindrodendrum hubeiense TaxID=595255 RepID=A0A9P5H6T0_9HYPO|nr:hypothetical protein G7Z17_g8252 [Cylindrodendrum hubeiense]